MGWRCSNFSFLHLKPKFTHASSFRARPMNEGLNPNARRPALVHPLTFSPREREREKPLFRNSPLDGRRKEVDFPAAGAAVSSEKMEFEVDEKELKASGAEPLPDGRRGLRLHGWEIESLKRPILNSRQLQEWEQKLQTSHFPEMVFGDSSLVLKHMSSGTKIHFNAFDALTGWKQEALPPVEVPAAAIWKFKTESFQQVILDYDYTFTTPYCGSETEEINAELGRGATSEEANGSLCWEECKEEIDVASLALKEPILFYDEVILYEDELGDNGISLLTAKVRVMPSSWYVLLRFWLRVDGVLMRLRDTRMHCVFGKSTNPIILRESCWREGTFKALSAKGYPSDSAAYNDPSIISQRLPVIMHKTQKLKLPVKP